MNPCRGMHPCCMGPSSVFKTTAMKVFQKGETQQEGSETKIETTIKFTIRRFFLPPSRIVWKHSIGCLLFTLSPVTLRIVHPSRCVQTPTLRQDFRVVSMHYVNIWKPKTSCWIKYANRDQRSLNVLYCQVLRVLSYPHVTNP